MHEPYSSHPFKSIVFSLLIQSLVAMYFTLTIPPLGSNGIRLGTQIIDVVSDISKVAGYNRSYFIPCVRFKRTLGLCIPC